MSLSSRITTDEFQQRVNGFYGTFVTAAGHVDYLETKASLSLGVPSPETRLTKFLLPVREALPSRDMDFNQLLQRDLDDHRVATELVPYLLTPSTAGPAFFPPVVAVMLPFDGTKPQDKFDADPINANSEDNLGTWSSTTVGRSYRFDRLLNDNGQHHELKLGRIHWNDECAKLVVVDGQHRAMALLAIHRTLTNTWSGAAEKYKSFYESAVNDALRGKSDDEKKRICSTVELPVTVIWFPNLTGESASHQVAARKLFVDVNKNARKPSASRLLLLSDRDLPSIFVRSSLNKFRSGSSFPIYAVEYDHPDSDEQSISKWSVITNVGNISTCVKRLLMGPPKYFGMSSEIVGRESRSELGDTLRNSLNVIEKLSSTEEEDGISYRRDELDATNFPPKRIELLTDLYSSGWGILIEKMFLELIPYATHAKALSQLYDGWSTVDATSRLAKDAVFEGVGVYWTLRDGDAHWRDLNAERAIRNSPPAPKTDVINSWEALTQKHAEFRKLRAALYLGSDSKDRESDAAFDMFKTAACQVGLVLAARALWETQNTRSYSLIPSFISTFISALNASLSNGRQLVFAKLDVNGKKRINLLDKLDTSKCVHFRYLWIQLLGTDEARKILSDASMTGDLDNLISVGRALYRKELINNMRKTFLRVHPNDEPLALNLATLEVDQSLKDGLSKWFAIRAPEYAEWLKHINTKNTVQPANNQPTEEDLEDGLGEGASRGPEEIQAPGDEELKKLLFDEGSEE